MNFRSCFTSLIAGFAIATAFTATSHADPAKPIEIEVVVTVPDSAWKLEVLEVHQTEKELIVISKVSRAGDAIGLQVVSTLTHKVKVVGPDLPVKRYVLGKTWGWENQDKGVEFIKDRKKLDEMLKGAKKLHP